MASTKRAALLVLLAACSSNDPLATPADASDASDAAAPSLDGGVDAHADTDAGVADAADATIHDASADAPNDPIGVFVAVGYGGRRMRSIDDGRTWTDDQSLARNGGDDMNLLRTVAFGNGLFVTAGWQALSSRDGKTWTPLPATHQNWFGALVFAHATWAAVGGYGMRLTSADGTTWSDHAIDTTAAHPHGCLVFDGARFVACNDNGQRSHSADGVTWSYSTGADAIKSSQLAVGAGVVVGVDGAAVVRSLDGGTTWSMAATLDSPGDGLVFAQGHFTLLANGAVFTSTDGAQWTKHASPNARPSALAFGHGTYVAVRAHEWQRSTDGVAWDPASRDTAQDNAFEWVAFGAP